MRAKLSYFCDLGKIFGQKVRFIGEQSVFLQAKTLLYMQRRAVFFFFPLFLALTIRAQDLAYVMAASDYRLDTVQTRSLSFELDNLSFFKDNEFEGQQSKGYSLPGLWLQPKLIYQPLDAVRLEAGLHAFILDGTNKYPCYAYHDIAKWKGNQYQRGAHVLPYFRVQAQLDAVTLVLGDIYGGANHRVMEPLWNPEVNLSQDPEMGLQVIADLSRWRLDAWVNWQSFVFEEDSHQEAFTVGVNQRILLNDNQSRIHWYLPIDVVVQHRGGEQDTTALGVETLTNGGVGLGLQWNMDRQILRRLTAEATFLACWQQSGQLWPFDFGMAGSASLSLDFAKNFRAFCGFYTAHNFVSLYGAPFYSTLSQKEEGARFSYLMTPHVGAEWYHTFAKDYTLGAKVDAYPLAAGRLTHKNGTVDAATFSTNFSFGVYFRCHPRFLLKRFR